MYAVVRWLDVLFGKGDTDYPFWLLTVRINILLFLFCSAIIIGWNLSPNRIRQALTARAEICMALALTGVAGVFRFLFVSANLMDFGGVPYSRLLLGYKGYFATAQFFSPLYELTARDIEHAIVFDRIAGTLTIPLVYALCRCLQPGATLLPVTAAFLFAVYPLHILFSASDALAVFSIFLAASAYLLLAGAEGSKDDRIVAVGYVGGFAGLALLTQVRYENALLLIPAALVLFARRGSLRLRPFVLSLIVSAAFIAIYAYESATSGLPYQQSSSAWHTLDLVIQDLALNPFMAIPVLLIGTAAVWACKGLYLGTLALLPWVAAFTVCVLTIGDGHGAARIYANWLILILPLAGYGFSLLLSASRRSAKAVAIAALLCLGAQPIIMRDCLTAQYLEIVENDRFVALVASLPPSTKRIIVPDDELTRRQSHTTLEVYQKYAAILAHRPHADRTQLVGLTDYLEHPQRTSCAEGACAFFFGLPCIQEAAYFPWTRSQCEELLRTRRTTILDEKTVTAAPFVDCSIYTGKSRERLCDPATKPYRFTVYQINE